MEKKKSNIHKTNLEPKKSRLEELREEKLDWEIKKLKGEMTNSPGFEKKFKTYTGPIILILTFICGVLTYYFKIKDYVEKMAIHEEIQYTSLQLEAIDNLADSNNWKQKAAMLKLTKGGLSSVEPLIERVKDIEKKSMVNQEKELDLLSASLSNIASKLNRKDYKEFVMQLSNTKTKIVSNVNVKSPTETNINSLYNITYVLWKLHAEGFNKLSVDTIFINEGVSLLNIYTSKKKDASIEIVLRKFYKNQKK